MLWVYLCKYTSFFNEEYNILQFNLKILYRMFLFDFFAFSFSENVYFRFLKSLVCRVFVQR